MLLSPSSSLLLLLPLLLFVADVDVDVVVVVVDDDVGRRISWLFQLLLPQQESIVAQVE